MTTSRQRSKKQREAALNPTLTPNSLEMRRTGRAMRRAIADTMSVIESGVASPGRVMEETLAPTPADIDKRMQTESNCRGTLRGSASLRRRTT